MTDHLKNLLANANRVADSVLYRDVVELDGGEILHVVDVVREKLKLTTDSSGADDGPPMEVVTTKQWSFAVLFVDEAVRPVTGKDFAIFGETADGESVELFIKDYNGHSDLLSEKKGDSRLFKTEEAASNYAQGIQGTFQS